MDVARRNAGHLNVRYDLIHCAKRSSRFRTERVDQADQNENAGGGKNHLQPHGNSSGYEFPLPGIFPADQRRLPPEMGMLPPVVVRFSPYRKICVTRNRLRTCSRNRSGHGHLWRFSLWQKKKGANHWPPEAVDKEGSTAFFVEFGIKQFRR